MDALKREKEARLRRNEDEFGEEDERARLALESAASARDKHAID